MDYQPGSVTDYEALSRAVAGMQAVLYMAMNIQKGTKRLGEEVCRNAWHAHGMSVNALRLCHPLARDEWLARPRERADDAPAAAHSARE